MAHNEAKIKKKWYRKWWGIVIILSMLFILAIFIAMAFYVLSIVKNDSFDNNLHISQNEKNYPDLKIIEGEDSYSIGSASPKITIVEFGDFACPYCKSSFSKIREISVKYKNDVKIIFRDFPAIAEHSEKLALAARCAGEQGLFWNMHDLLFVHQGISENEKILALAGQIGADESRFAVCMEQKKYLPAIRQDYEDARELEITGTPTWFFNGQKVSGDIPSNILEQIIEKMLELDS